jgi:hypothetical protein
MNLTIDRFAWNRTCQREFTILYPKRACELGLIERRHIDQFEEEEVNEVSLNPLQ